MSAPDKIWLEPDHAREFSGEPDEINAEFFQCYVPIALIAEAVAREREACAATTAGYGGGNSYAAKMIAAAIRARGQG
jgi:hypothetical protein